MIVRVSFLVSLLFVLLVGIVFANVSYLKPSLSSIFTCLIYEMILTKSCFLGGVKGRAMVFL